jgi:glycosyltransferase involved in cell wall biosynthesis
VKVSAVIITFNEEKNIADAIRSVEWADEILVVDSESTDRTREIAGSLGARVIVNEWPGFAAQKQLAADEAANDWIFSLDADERVSDPLINEISAIKESGATAHAYTIPRLSIYMDREIRHSGWYPDRQLRFFNRTKGRWKQVLVHESIEMESDATVATLKGDILHYSVESAAHHHKMIGERYAPLAAEQMFANGRRTSPLKIVTSGWAAFIRTYFLKAGFLDGFPGFCIAYFAAHHAFMKHLMLYEMQQSADSRR